MIYTVGVLTAASLDSVTALPDHGADGAAEHVCVSVSQVVPVDTVQSRTLDQTGEERLVLEIGIWDGSVKLLERGSLGSGQWLSRCSLEGVTSFDGSKLVARDTMSAK